MARTGSTSGKGSAKSGLTISSPVATQTPASAAPDKHEASRTVDKQQRQAMIAEAAYFRAQLRGFVSGGEVEDWLAAEDEVHRRLLAP